MIIDRHIVRKSLAAGRDRVIASKRFIMFEAKASRLNCSACLCPAWND